MGAPRHQKRPRIEREIKENPSSTCVQFNVTQYSNFFPEPENLSFLAPKVSHLMSMYYRPTTKLQTTQLQQISFVRARRDLLAFWFKASIYKLVDGI